MKIVGLRQNLDKNVSKWAKNLLSALKFLDQAFWGVIRGPVPAGLSLLWQQTTNLELCSVDLQGVSWVSGILKDGDVLWEA